MKFNQKIALITGGSRGLGKNTALRLAAYGAIETDFTKPAFDADPQRKEMIASLTALGRVGVPDDIGGVVDFCAHRMGAGLTGRGWKLQAEYFYKSNLPMCRVR